MTKALHLRGYRTFDHFEIDNLARVNLLVGKNGCGKTSILEAIQILETQGFVGTLRDIAYQRGETALKEQQDRSRSDFLISHFFHGRDFAIGASFEIEGDSKRSKVRAQVVDASSLDEQHNLFDDIPSDSSINVLEISGKQYPVFDDGALFVGRPLNFRRQVDARRRPTPVQFVSADSLNLGIMHVIWNNLLIDSKEEEVVSAMRILDPSIDGVYFLSDYDSRRSPPRSHGAILVSFNDGRGRLPLGSTGEGMKRLLALALALTQAKGGVLLVDEIDTGLHYSVLGQMWLLIVEAARKMDIQVFATTHSLDCVKGLAWLCENHSDLREEVALHKIDESLDHSVAFDAEQIAIADEQGIEVR